MLPEQTDIAIIGGGMVGLSLALLLAKQLSQSDILLVEAMPLLDMAITGALPPSFDARSTALAESSRSILAQVGLWDELALCPITAIHVSDRGHPGATRLEASDAGLAGLGYVVENRQLGQVLIAAVRELGNIHICAPAMVEKLTPVAAGMQLQVAGQQTQAALAVVADGANSGVLQQLGIHTSCKDYQQTALVANIALASPHGGVAYERFTDTGPMALLPLLDVDGHHRAALVWTLSSRQAAEMLVADQQQFLNELHRRFGFRAGRFLRCGERSSYPLKLMVAQEQVRSHLAVAGNAAHFLHPVAGQGFNLALRDVARLAETVVAAVRRGESPGSLATLESYLAAQQQDQRNTIGFSHSLPALFTAGMPPAIALRNAGLVALDLLPTARDTFARFGAGLLNPGVKIHG